MIESGFTAAVHKKLPSFIHTWKIRDDYAGGVPDAFYMNCRDGGFLFVEYKYYKSTPKRPTTLMKANLSPLQEKWAEMAQAASVPHIVILGAQNRGVMLHGGKRSISVQDFHEKSMGYKELADKIIILTRKSINNDTKL